MGYRLIQFSVLNKSNGYMAAPTYRHSKESWRVAQAAIFFLRREDERTD